jgi:hypothetical protein
LLLGVGFVAVMAPPLRRPDRVQAWSLPTPAHGSRLYEHCRILE